MHVAIDARELCGHQTGVGRYLSELLTAWADSDRARRHQWTLIAHAPIDGAAQWAVATSIVNGSGGTAWEQMTLPGAVAAVKADVLFAPGYTAPLTVTAPLVLTIHDVSYFAHPEWFSFREGTRRRMLTAWSARRARKVITDSDFSKAEIERFIGVKNVRAVPLGIDRSDAVRLKPDPHRIPVESDGIPVGSAFRRTDNDRANVLYVGSVFERRRVDRLIASFDQIVARVPHATLDIVGENRTRGLDLEALRRRSTHAERIHIRSYVDETTLAQLYRDASVFVFLSEYEGFGLTPLEALSQGVPPVVLDTAIAREICGDAATYVSPSATNDEIAATIADLITNGESRRAVLARAESVLGRYDWARTADETLTVLEEAAVGR
jgi:glycosyltransferase involved in cell wall biosynthesis